MDQPQFKHDCNPEGCKFLGRFYDGGEHGRGPYDGWVHFRDENYCELIRRFSNDESDYGCMTYSYGQPQSLSDAYKDVAIAALGLRIKLLVDDIEDTIERRLGIS